MLSLRENRKGQPASMARRGTASIYLHETLIITVDGVRISDYELLQSLAAETILSIFIITGIEGTTYHGTNAVGGVVEIRTKDGSDA